MGGRVGCAMPEYVTTDSCQGQMALVKERHEEVLKALRDIHDVQADTNKRLFKDNGAASIQTQLDRNNRINSVIIWLGASIGTTLLGLIVVAFCKILALHASLIAIGGK